MKKNLSLILIICLCPLIGGVYGIIHDQITYTISPEYYTRFKFYQFGIIHNDTETLSNIRLAVAKVGFLATWWMGIPIGILLSLISITIKNGITILQIASKAILLTIIIALTVGLLGLIYGKYYLAEKGVNWKLPKNLEDSSNFIAVGSMHNFSYLGGLIGMLFATVYSIRKKYRKRK